MSKILLVEDDNNLREIYAARLDAEGYQIISASDGEEALAIAVREQPDLIISDVMMPKISGFDMLDILRSTPETADIRVIMMTALGQDEDRERGKALGADHYIVKSQATLEDVVDLVKREFADMQGISGSDSAGQDSSPTPVQSNQQLAPETYQQQDESSINSTDTAILNQEVEQFVASSPLMNGVAPRPQASAETRTSAPERTQPRPLQQRPTDQVRDPVQRQAPPNDINPAPSPQQPNQ